MVKNSLANAGDIGATGSIPENNQGTKLQNVWTLIVRRQHFILGKGFEASTAMHSGPGMIYGLVAITMHQGH